MSEAPRGGARHTYQSFRRAPFVAPALILIALSLLCALFADSFAADQPLFLRLNGQVHLLPNLRRPAALRPYTNQTLRESLGSDDYALFPPIPWGPNTHDLDHVLSPPSSLHWLGTDPSGRDVAARIVHGARVTLTVSVLGVSMLVLLGLLLGTLAGYLGGIVDSLVNRVAETLSSIPSLLLFATILGVLNPQGGWSVLTMTAAIGLLQWTSVARLVRAEVLRVRVLPYVEAARALGLSSVHVMLRHVLPNCLSPVFVATSFAMASAILTEGALSFVGFGVPDDIASWGGLLNGVRGNTQAWWLVLFPGMAILATVAAFNIIAEGLRMAFGARVFGR